MKQLGLALIVATLVIAGGVQAETPIQAGEWETTEKTTITTAEGVQPMPAVTEKTCLKGGDAKLERLLFPTLDEMKQQNCKYAEEVKKAGALSATLVCSPSGSVAGITAKAEISYTATSYDGRGQMETKDKSGAAVKGSSVLSGRRLGDCP